jgi:hypothetical protein
MKSLSRKYTATITNKGTGNSIVWKLVRITAYALTENNKPKNNDHDIPCRLSGMVFLNILNKIQPTAVKTAMDNSRIKKDVINSVIDTIISRMR